jgi:lipopolysaccharide/colanic/teichoic acid biosynthesis glycosyltransferase
LAEVVARGAELLWQCSTGGGDLAPFIGPAAPAASRWIVPSAWRSALGPEVASATPDELVAGLTDRSGPGQQHPWTMISCGRFVTRLDARLLAGILTQTSADVVAVTARSDLLAYRERVRLTAGGELVGYRRLYRDCVEPTPMPTHWPHHLLVRRTAIEPLLSDGFPNGFPVLLERVRAAGLSARAAVVGGAALDLESHEGLLALSRIVLRHPSHYRMKACVVDGKPRLSNTARGGVIPGARLVGPVLLGEGAVIEADAVVVGPSVLCDRSVIAGGAMVDSSIVGADASVQSGEVVSRGVVVNGIPSRDTSATWRCSDPLPKHVAGEGNRAAFRSWPPLSYVGLYKRAADVIAAGAVLILFAPIIPFIALAIKINSPGPVFYADRRQGRYGELFNCLKFRTMRVDAAEIQEKLRFVSEVDGPQFKMADDPRISAVGRFLRETYLDEIPQFFNVLCGQMSVVGPRPSPESENTLCPSWRDARLSVRPGITGMWQVFRTREPLRDFQEWIYYDTQYVKNLSLKTDLWICWKTFTRMLHNFARQF